MRRGAVEQPVALRARSQSIPGISRIAGAASGISDTLAVTAIPIPMATAAAATIWRAEPGSLRVSQKRLPQLLFGASAEPSMVELRLMVGSASFSWICFSIIATSFCAGEQ